LQLFAMPIERCQQSVIVKPRSIDPISAVGIAAAALQFAQFGAAIFKSSKEVYRSSSGIPKDIESLESIDSKLSELCQELQTEDNLLHQDQAAVPSTIGSSSSLDSLVKACQQDCARLLDVVKKVQMSGKSGPKSWQSFQVAIKGVLKVRNCALSRTASMAIKAFFISELLPRQGMFGTFITNDRLSLMSLSATVKHWTDLRSRWTICISRIEVSADDGSNNRGI
jgi:hypothetical protein